MLETIGTVALVALACFAGGFFVYRWQHSHLINDLNQKLRDMERQFVSNVLKLKNTQKALKESEDEANLFRRQLAEITIDKQAADDALLVSNDLLGDARTHIDSLKDQLLNTRRESEQLRRDTASEIDKIFVANEERMKKAEARFREELESDYASERGKLKAKLDKLKKLNGQLEADLGKTRRDYQRNSSILERLRNERDYYLKEFAQAQQENQKLLKAKIKGSPPISGLEKTRKS